MKRNENGFAHVLILLVAVVVLVGLGTLAYWNYNRSNSDETISQEDTANSGTPITSTEERPALEEATLLGGKIHIVVPTGWSTLDNAEEYASLQHTVNVGIHKIGFQFTNEDYLKGSYGGNISVIKETKTAKGTVIYIIKTMDSYVAVSTCEPTTDDKGCSLTLDGMFLYISLYAYQSGDQAVRELDFNTEETDTSIADFIKVAESLDI